MRTLCFRLLVPTFGALSLVSAGSAQSGPFQGSVSPPASAGVPADQPVKLSLDDALQRGLRYNLGAVLSLQDSLHAQGAVIASRADLLPNLSTGLRETVQQIDLAAFGFKLPPGSPFTFPQVLGPSNYFDLRATLTQRVADLQALRTYQSSREAQRAADLNAVNARETVVYVVTAGYLEVLAESARVDSARGQLATAQAIYQQAQDRFSAGLSAKIDRTRSEVELQTQKQRVTAEQAQYAKDKIALARLIGFPAGEDLILTDALPYAPLENLTLPQAISLAADNRSDLKSAQAQVRAAELSVKAAHAERYPTLDIGGDYGLAGVNPGNSHGSYSATAQVRFPIWAGGHSKGDIEEADASLQRMRSEYDELCARVEAQVRTAYLDLNAAADQVQVAQSRRELAQDELAQARDRFSSGVADTVEVVQAQEAVSSAEQDYIASLNAHNLAKASVAHAVGQAEKIIRTLLRSQ
ncbi:MAG: TolC family protein [Acidobacteriia bacterium]|nr:TolC family protein [Terriglobia bacterium]